MQRDERVLVLGGTGFLGSHFVDSLGNRAIVHTTKEGPAITASGYLSKMFLRSRMEEIEVFLREQNCRTIINCIALADIERCESNPEFAYWINCELPGFLSKISKSLDSKFVHISTDAVFNGIIRFPTELDETSPLSVYGQSKRDGEKLVLSNNSQSIVTRVNFFGQSNNKASLFNFFYENMLSEKIVEGYTDVFFTPLYAGHLVSTILELLNLETSGLFHVVGGERISKFEFGVRIAEAFNLPKSNLKEGKLGGTPGEKIRSLDLSLSNAKVKSLGIIIPSVQDGLSILKKNLT